MAKTLPRSVYLIIAVTIFAAANAFTRLLTDIGAANPIQGRNPISFCNVLFVGNLCALLPLFLFFRHQITGAELRRLHRKDWVALIGVAVLSGALAPALIFWALDVTSVNSVILIGRIEPPLILALSVLLLKARVNRWIVAGSVLAFMGAALTVLLPAPQSTLMSMAGTSLGQGELLALGGAIAAALAGILSKVTLQTIPLGLFNIVRTLLGTIIFFVAALYLFGPIHFADVFSPLLWGWMLIYGAVIIVGGQLCWFAGLKSCSASEVSLASSFTPILGILAAYLILGEIPTWPQLIGGIVILMGIALNQIGIMRQVQGDRPAPLVRTVPQEIVLKSENGFRGV